MKALDIIVESLVSSTAVYAFEIAAGFLECKCHVRAYAAMAFFHPIEYVDLDAIKPWYIEDAHHPGMAIVFFILLIEPGICSFLAAVAAGRYAGDTMYLDHTLTVFYGEEQELVSMPECTSCAVECVEDTVEG